LGLFSLCKNVSGYGKDVEGKSLFGLEIWGFRKGLLDRKNSEKRGLFVDVRVVLHRSVGDL